MAQLNFQTPHDTVNQTQKCVDPNTGITINRVEAMWQRIQDTFKDMNGPFQQGYDF